MSEERLRILGLAKSFTLHNQGGLRLPVFERIELAVGSGECLVLHGPSGIGKSTLLRAIYGNYLPERGHILVRHGGTVVDMAAAPPRVILDVRRRSMGFVSQFLRVIPRVPALDIVAEPLRRLGRELADARARAEAMLARLAIPRRLWGLPPATFSGGEQQRVNIARGFVGDHPLLLLDEPTASLDAANRAVVTELINERKRQGTAVVAIVHDADVRDLIADRLVDVTAFALAA